MALTQQQGLDRYQHIFKKLFDFIKLSLFMLNYLG
jgi:hypothetical protein